MTKLELHETNRSPEAVKLIAGSFNSELYAAASVDVQGLSAYLLLEEARKTYPGIFNNAKVFMDIGCGDAAITLAVATTHMEEGLCYGLDNSDDMLRLSRKNLASAASGIDFEDAKSSGKESLQDRVKFIKADFTEGFLSEEFSGLPKVNIVFSNYALHWLSDLEAHKKFLEDVSRIVADDSVIMLTFLGKDSTKELLWTSEQVFQKPSWKHLWKPKEKSSPFFADAGEYQIILDKSKFRGTARNVIRTPRLQDERALADWFRSSVRGQMSLLKNESLETQKRFALEVASDYRKYLMNGEFELLPKDLMDLKGDSPRGLPLRESVVQVLAKKVA